MSGFQLFTLCDYTTHIYSYYRTSVVYTMRTLLVAQRCEDDIMLFKPFSLKRERGNRRKYRNCTVIMTTYPIISWPESAASAYWSAASNTARHVASALYSIIHIIIQPAARLPLLTQRSARGPAARYAWAIQPVLGDVGRPCPPGPSTLAHSRQHQPLSAA